MNQRNTSWNAPYTFSGKEKDAETGYGYFGDRYYDSGLSIWLSVDSMSDERSWLTPYNYCQNNPIVITDLNGALDDGYTVDEFGNFTWVSSVGGKNYDVIYSKQEYDKGKRDYDGSGQKSGIIIYDKKFIPAMEQIKPDKYTTAYDFNCETGEYTYYDIFVSIYNTKSNLNKEQKGKTNYGGLFFFLANNCKEIEWSIGRTNNGDLCIGTYRSSSSAPNPSDFGLTASQFNSYLHSHTTKHIAGESISFGSDFGVAGSFKLFQVYFPHSQNLYTIKNINGKVSYGSIKLNF